MENYKERLEKQLAEIDAMIERTDKDLAKFRNLPERRIEICRSNGCTQYYWVDRESKKRSYVKTSEKSLLRKIAQREYEQAVNRKLKNNRKQLAGFLLKYDVEKIDEIYNSMADSRKDLIVPLAESDEEYERKWRSVTYDPMPIQNETGFYSDCGVRVRSKSELLIANGLEQKGIPYRYEYPLDLRGMGSVRPDFLCLNVRTRQEYIWEHFGMMDNEAYANKNVAKIQAYEQNGYFAGKNMIMTFETSQQAIRSNIIKTVIGQYLI